MLKQMPCLIYFSVSNLKQIRPSINICGSKPNHIEACHFKLDAFIQMVGSILPSRVNYQNKDIHTGRYKLRSAIPSLSINLSLQQSGQKFHQKNEHDCQTVSRLGREKNHTVQEGSKRVAFVAFIISSKDQFLCQFLPCLFSHIYWLSDNADWKHFPLIGPSNVGKILIQLTTFNYEIHYLKSDVA